MFFYILTFVNGYPAREIRQAYALPGAVSMQDPIPTTTAEGQSTEMRVENESNHPSRTLAVNLEGLLTMPNRRSDGVQGSVSYILYLYSTDRFIAVMSLLNKKTANK